MAPCTQKLLFLGPKPLSTCWISPLKTKPIWIYSHYGYNSPTAPPAAAAAAAEAGTPALYCAAAVRARVMSWCGDWSLDVGLGRSPTSSGSENGVYDELHSLKLTVFPPKKMMVSNRNLRKSPNFQGVSQFSGAMLVSGRVVQNIHANRANLKKCWISLGRPQQSGQLILQICHDTQAKLRSSQLIRMNSTHKSPNQSKNVSFWVPLSIRFSSIFRHQKWHWNHRILISFPQQKTTHQLVKRRPPKLQNSWSSLVNSGYHMLYFMDCWPTFTVNNNAKRRSMLRTCYHLNIIVKKVKTNGRSISPIIFKK